MGFSPNRAGRILAARKHPITVGCCFPGVENDFFIDVASGYRAAQREFGHYGVSVKMHRLKGYEPEEHLAAIKLLVEQGCGALCISTVDTPEIRRCVDELVDSGIPVITVNNDLTNTKRLCYVGTDYLRGGSVAAALLCKMTPSPMNLLVVTGSLYMKGHNERVRGFSHTLRKYGLPYNTIDVFESLDSDTHAYNRTRQILQEHPETNCIFIAAAGTAGVGRAVKELGLQNSLVLSSCDDIPSTKELMRDGVVDFTVCQQPWEQGYRAIQLLFDYIVDNREKTPEDFITDTVIKIKENIV